MSESDNRFTQLLAELIENTHVDGSSKDDPVLELCKQAWGKGKDDEEVRKNIVFFCLDNSEKISTEIVEEWLIDIIRAEQFRSKQDCFDIIRLVDSKKPTPNLVRLVLIYLVICDLHPDFRYVLFQEWAGKLSNQFVTKKPDLSLFRNSFNLFLEENQIELSVDQLDNLFLLWFKNHYDKQTLDPKDIQQWCELGDTREKFVSLEQMLEYVLRKDIHKLWGLAEKIFDLKNEARIPENLVWQVILKLSSQPVNEDNIKAITKIWKFAVQKIKSCNPGEPPLNVLNALLLDLKNTNFTFPDKIKIYKDCLRKVLNDDLNLINSLNKYFLKSKNDEVLFLIALDNIKEAQQLRELSDEIKQRLSGLMGSTNNDLAQTATKIFKLIPEKVIPEQNPPSGAGNPDEPITEDVLWLRKMLLIISANLTPEKKLRYLQDELDLACTYFCEKNKLFGKLLSKNQQNAGKGNSNSKPKKGKFLVLLESVFDSTSSESVFKAINQLLPEPQENGTNLAVFLVALRFDRFNKNIFDRFSTNVFGRPNKNINKDDLNEIKNSRGETIKLLLTEGHGLVKWVAQKDSEAGRSKFWDAFAAFAAFAFAAALVVLGILYITNQHALSTQPVSSTLSAPALASANPSPSLQPTHTSSPTVTPSPTSSPTLAPSPTPTQPGDSVAFLSTPASWNSDNNLLLYSRFNEDTNVSQLGYLYKNGTGQIETNIFSVQDCDLGLDWPFMLYTGFGPRLSMICWATDKAPGQINSKIFAWHLDIVEQNITLKSETMTNQYKLAEIPSELISRIRWSVTNLYHVALSLDKNAILLNEQAYYLSPDNRLETSMSQMTDNQKIFAYDWIPESEYKILFVARKNGEAVKFYHVEIDPVSVQFNNTQLVELITTDRWDDLYDVAVSKKEPIVAVAGVMNGEKTLKLYQINQITNFMLEPILGYHPVNISQFTEITQLGWSADSSQLAFAGKKETECQNGCLFAIDLDTLKSDEPVWDQISSIDSLGIEHFWWETWLP